MDTVSFRQIGRTAWNRKFDLFIWLIYNVGIGTASIWIVGLLWLLATNPGFSWTTPIENGGLAVFVVTLCGSQAALFAELTEARFLNINKMALGLFLLIVIAALSIGVMATLAGSGIAQTSTQPPGTTTPPSFGVSSDAVFRASIVVFVVAVVFCLYLYSTRLVADAFDPEQLSEQLVEKAHSNAQVDGIEL